MLSKIKAQLVAGGLALVGGVAVWLTTEVDYEAILPGGGIVLATVIGYAVKLGRPEIEDYLNKLDD